VAEDFRVFRHVGFFRFCAAIAASTSDGRTPIMDNDAPSIAKQLAEVTKSFQQKRTGRAPSAVTVVLSEDTLVVTLHGALSPAEEDLAKSPQGAADLQEYHRELFRHSVASLMTEIERITGRKVREAAAEIDTATGTVVHAFTTGTMVQVFLLAEKVASEHGTENITFATA